jgi:ankyrin repeat protein
MSANPAKPAKSSARDFVSELRIPSPCDVAWDSMIGNDRVRFCEHCHLSVHNIDLASPKQIKRLIARSKGRLCVNYLAPAPPKPPAPVLYKIGRRTSIIAASAFSATLSISSAVAAAPNLKQNALLQQPTYTRLLAAQTPTSGGSRLYGFVFDPNGAAITGAAVLLTNMETNTPYHSFTGGDGQYQFEGLAPGTYHLKVSYKGFETSDLPGLSVRANDNNRIDQTLSIAPVEAEVTVTSETEKFIVSGAVAVSLPTDPLVKAAMDDDLEAVKTLLLSHKDVNERDKATENTALDRAIQNGNREMVQVLLWAKANVNSRDSDGETPLMMIGEDTTSEIVWDLINNGAKVNLRDDDGDTALIAVAELDNVEALKVLLDAGAKVNDTNNDGQTALMLAAENGKVHNVRALILAGADVNARDADGHTALMLAKEADEPAVIRLLKAHGAIEFEAPQKQ